MARSRRSFLRETAVAGAALSIFGMSDAGAGEPKTPCQRHEPGRSWSSFALRYPIFQAPYGGPELASAISNAGAMGAIALWGSTRKRLARTSCESAVKRNNPSSETMYLRSRLSHFRPRLKQASQWCSFCGGLPTKELVAALRQTGAKFGVHVGSAEGARAALDLGADYVVSQGSEAGGHVQSSTPLYELRGSWRRRRELRCWWPAVSAMVPRFGPHWLLARQGRSSILASSPAERVTRTRVQGRDYSS